MTGHSLTTVGGSLRVHAAGHISVDNPLRDNLELSEFGFQTSHPMHEPGSLCVSPDTVLTAFMVPQCMVQI